jgi:type IV pilus assembly protein PilB
VPRLRIGELLVEAKLVTREQLEVGLAAQQKSGRKLGQVLIELGIVSETQLTQALSQQLSVPWVSLYHIDFSRELLNLVPQELAETFCLVPVFVRRVRKQGDTLYVAMDDPTHEAALQAVMRSSSLPVRPMIASPSDIRSAIRVYYGVTPLSVPDGPGIESAGTRPTAVQQPRPPESEVVTVQLIADGPPLPSAVSSSPVPIAEAILPAPPSEIPSSEIPSLDAATSEDSPNASPTVEAHTLPPKRARGPKMVSLTLLDGTTIRVPAKPKNVGSDRPSPAPGAMTARDLIRTLRAVSQGADTTEILGEKVPLEAICAALLSLLLRKGLLADWEFVDELRKT